MKPLDHSRQPRALQRRQLELGFFGHRASSAASSCGRENSSRSGSRRPPSGRTAENGPQIDLCSTWCWTSAPRAAHAPADPLLGHPRKRGCTGWQQAFDTAITEYEYRGRFRGVYPIKVNQQRHVVEEIVQYGASEAERRPRGRQQAGAADRAGGCSDTPDALIICNGYKDRAYIETALLAQRLGRTPVIVIDRFRELELLIKISRELRHPPAHR